MERSLALTLDSLQGRLRGEEGQAEFSACRQFLFHTGSFSQSRKELGGMLWPHTPPPTTHRHPPVVEQDTIGGPGVDEAGILACSSSSSIGT